MKRHLWTGAGLLFVGIGAIGAVLPLLPTVPFLLLALFCFARGNPVWERRLLAHPHYGPMLLDWRTRRAIPRKAKIAALVTMAISVVVTGLAAGWPWLLIPLAALAIGGTWLWTRAE